MPARRIIAMLCSAKRRQQIYQVFPAVSTLHCWWAGQSHISCSLHTLQCILMSMSSARTRSWRNEGEEEIVQITRGKIWQWGILIVAERDRKITVWCGSAFLGASQIHLGILVGEFSNVCQKYGIQSQISQIRSLIQTTQTCATLDTSTHMMASNQVWISFASHTKCNYFKLLGLNVCGKAITWIQNMANCLFPYIFPEKLKYGKYFSFTIQNTISGGHFA